MQPQRCDTPPRSRRFHTLCGLFSDGRIEIASNTVERSMRPIAMGRRHSLFSGSEGSDESWAILASLINTAKLHELDPQAYLIWLRFLGLG
jgi:transposase